MCPPAAAAMDMWKVHMRTPSSNRAAPRGRGKEITCNTGLPTAPMLGMAREQGQSQRLLRPTQTAPHPSRGNTAVEALKPLLKDRARNGNP